MFMKHFIRRLRSLGVLSLVASSLMPVVHADVTNDAGATHPAAQQKSIIFQLAGTALLTSSFEVSNGIVVRREDWPTLVLAQTGPAPRPETCTGTLVGPRTILTAAHCVDGGSGKPLRARLLVGSSLVPLHCDIHPDYLEADYAPTAPRSSRDYALCLITTVKKYAALTALRFEVVETQSSLEAGDRIMFTGYGCDRLSISSTGQLTWSEAKGKLSIGNGVVEVASGTWPSHLEYLTVRSNPAKDPAVCPGDSGGPLFSAVSAFDPAAGKSRRVRGVNSRVCAQLKGISYTACAPFLVAGTYDAISSVAATATPSFQSWAEQWLKEERNEGAIICGVNRKAGEVPCRD